MKNKNRRYCCVCGRWVFTLVSSGVKGLLGESMIVENHIKWTGVKPKNADKHGYFCLECYQKLSS